MLKRNLIISILCLLFSTTVWAQSFTISGYVVDDETGETLIGATVVNSFTNLGTSTDGNGFFRLSGVKSTQVKLIISHVGYQKQEISLEKISKSILLETVRLIPIPFEIEEVSIVGKRHETVGDREVETSQQRISPQTIINIPTASGDIFRAIRYFPGIQSTEPTSPLYTARGSDPSGNLVLLDGVAIYNPYHYVQSGSLFNIQSVKNIDVLVGGFGAEFGGRNASILYITTKDGHMGKLSGEVEPTTSQTKLFLEFPVGQKSSVMLAGRYFYDIFGYFLFDSKSYFYDYNLSYTNRINNRNKLTLKVFDSKDNMKFNPQRMLKYISNSFPELDFYDETNMDLGNVWSNRAATAYLKTVVSPSVYLHTQVYASYHQADNYSGFDFDFQPDTSNLIMGLHYNTQFSSKIRDLNAKSALSIKAGTAHTFKVGAELSGYHFANSASINGTDQGRSIREPLLISAFAEDKIKLADFILRPGVRLTRYSLHSKWEVEPRLNMAVSLPNRWKLKAAWGIYNQYIISMNTQEYEVNQFLDYYYPLSQNRPSQSIHYILGAEKEFDNSSLSVELYHFDMPVTYTFDLNLSEQEAHSFTDKLVQGTGKSYGLEVMYRAEFNRISGWVSYGLAKSTRSYPHIMDGKPFLFDFDRKHSIKTMLSYKIAPRLTYNFSMLALSGLPKTVETAMQNYQYYNPITGTISFFPLGVSTVKNNARLPWVVHLDMGILKQIRSGFAAELQNLIGAKGSYYTISISNILFLKRNVIWYLPYGGDKYLPLGVNYFPMVSAGYVIKF